jgi:NADP-dependent 3-hydroxy acid dehydrogenase YdfG
VRLGDKQKADQVYAGMTPLTAEDIAETIGWIFERPARINIEEITIYPTDQASPTLVHRKIQS